MRDYAPLQTLKKDKLSIRIYDSKEIIGKAAARFVAQAISNAIHEKGSASIILATGASQFLFIDTLKSMNDIDWSRVTVFHLDEYKGMSDQHPTSFRRYL